tara:strand:+ start:1072 stop:1956 length:885 start_codon:yes stop_codon:yes gene_type:complete
MHLRSMQLRVGINDKPNPGWIMGKKLGSGSFGDVYLGNAENDENDENKKMKVAIKLEEDKDKNKKYLKNEYDFYKILNKDNKEKKFVPQCYYFNHEGIYNVLVIDYLSSDLYSLYPYNNIESLANIANKLLNCIEYIHSKNIIHRDLSPNNIRSHNNELFIIDFGASKIYFDKNNNTHIPNIKKNKTPGTRRYQSINSMELNESSRRDDLESIGYILVEYYIGKLPWEQHKKDIDNTIKSKKESIESGRLFQKCPNELKIYINYCRNLKFDEKPDYKYLKKLFYKLFKRRITHF